MSAETLITDHLDLWTEAITKKSNSGRGSNGKIELTGLKKLREFILELAIQGKLVTQVSNDGSAEQLLRDIENEIKDRAKNKEIRKVKKLPKVKVDEHPFPIPKSWAYCRLNEIGSWGSGATPKRGNPDYYGGPYPWFKSGELKDDFIDSSEESITPKALEETSVRLNKPGDVLIAMYGATIGKASILKVEATTNQAVCACSPWHGIANKYLLLLLKAYRSRFIAMGAGGAQPNISREKIVSTVIGLPPEKEQVRIVQKVDELMALCDRLEQQTSDQIAAHDTLVDTLLGTLTQSQNATELAENWTRLAAHFDTLFTTEKSIDKLKQTILQLAVMGKLIEQGKLSESGIDHLQKISKAKEEQLTQTKGRKSKPLPPIEESEIPFALPQGWSIARLDDITDIQSGIAKGKKKTGKKTCLVPYLRVANVQRAALNLSEIKEIEIVEDDVERYLIVSRDLLITEGGDWDKVGRTAIWEGAISPIIHQNHVFRARLYLPDQSEAWIEKYLNSQFARSYFADSSKQTTNLASINKTQLRSCTIPMPPPQEQDAIIKKANLLFSLCDDLAGKVRKAGETQLHLAETLSSQAISG